jgi:hypothetical protein
MLIMATLPNPKKNATEQLQRAFSELVGKQMETMSSEEIYSAREDVRKIVTKARAARGGRPGKVK